MPWLVAVALFMENLDATIVNTAVPTMAASLGVAPLSLKAVLTSYTLSLAIFIPVSGWFADRFGTRRVFTTAIWLFLFGSLGCGLAPNVPLLVAARILQGHRRRDDDAGRPAHARAHVPALGDAADDELRDHPRPARARCSGRSRAA